MDGSKIFISYRRADSSGYAGRLYDRLSAHYGDEQIFMDLEMEFGVDFVDKIEDAVSSCAVMLVMIGPGWLNARDGENRRRLDDGEDFVRIEVTNGLARSTRVIPVLVGNAGMPDDDDLPPALRALARRNAVELSDSRWDYDVGRLVRTVDKVVNPPAEPPPAPPAEPPPVDHEPPAVPPAPPPDHRLRNALIAVAGVAVLIVVLVIVLGGDGNKKGGGKPRNAVELGKDTEPWAIAVDPRRNALWVAERKKGAIAWLQTSPLKLERSYQLPAGSHPTNVVVGADGVVWASDPIGKQLLRKSVGSDRFKPIALPDNTVPHGIALDDKGRLLVADSSNGGRVLRRGTIGLTTGFEPPWPVPGNLRGIAPGGNDHIVWVSDPDARAVVRLDTRDGSTIPITIKTGGKPIELARDPVSKRIWAADGETGNIIRISLETESPTTQDDFSQVPKKIGTEPSGLAIVDGIIWVTDTAEGQVAALSNASPYHHLMSDRQVGDGPEAVAALGRRAWVTNADDGTVSEVTAPAG